ncbi:SagB family peptide dehydrogenase [Nonomuraea sp. NPDC004580]|uniref:SagB family peptide dehydrogenase n=1 Tax=Nonomuraea sp. NPDC004580 TaxID=3154552 RepID=UPI0033A8DFE7
MHTTTAPGAATSRYLAAMRNRRPLDIDWAAAPTRHKRYPRAERVPLPWNAAHPLGELLRHLLGLTRIVWSHHLGDGGRPLGRPPMLLAGRPAPSGGGLYPVEAYVAAGEPHVPAALYHYDPVHHVVERVRGGDHVPALAGLLGGGDRADVVVVLSAVFWRSMFKYGDFGYRLVCQETGVLIAQALAVAERLGLEGGAHLRFADGEVDRLLGLDGAREAALAALTLSHPPAKHPQSEPPSLDELVARPTAEESRPLPRPMPAGGLAAALHRACTLAAPRSSDRPASPRPPARAARPAPEPAPMPPEAGMERRASPLAGCRPVPLAGDALGAVLRAACAGYPSDLPGTAKGPATTALCLLSLRVDGLPRAAYWYDPAGHTLHEPPATIPVDAVTTGPLLPNTQVALRGAAAVLIPVGDPVAGAPAFGDRWYRMQQMEAGLIVQRAALAATALGLAARIHSDGANETTDEVLGLAASPLRSLSFLVMGTPPTGGPLVTRPIHGLVSQEVMPPDRQA